jgi:hypothetical protein
VEQGKIMRKVFWCCTAAAIVAAGSVYLAAKHIDRNPGEVLASLIGGGVASGSCPATPSGEPMPADPTPADPAPHTAVPLPCPREVVVSTGDKLGTEIAVEEGAGPMTSCVESHMAGEEMPPASMATIDMSGSSACEGSAPMASCPTVMPYCPDEKATSRRMPYADEEECEESADDMAGWLEMAEQVISGVAEAVLSDAFSGTDGEEMPQPYKCPEEEYHRQHSEYCPYTGRSYPSTYVPCPAVPDPEEQKTDEGEQKPKDAPKMKSSRKEQELPPPLTDLDTMEFRPSDAGLQRFIPGPL